jgi:hypothetical protein
MALHEFGIDVQLDFIEGVAANNIRSHRNLIREERKLLLSAAAIASRGRYYLGLYNAGRSEQMIAAASRHAIQARNLLAAAMTAYYFRHQTKPIDPPNTSLSAA